MSPFRCPFGPWVGFGALAIAFASTVLPVASLAGDSDCIDYGGSFMQRVGRLQRSGLWSVALAGDLAYVAAERSITIVDLSNPAIPVVQGSVSIPLGDVTEIVISDGYAYVDESGVMGEFESNVNVFSLANPEAPVLVG